VRAKLHLVLAIIVSLCACSTSTSTPKGTIFLTPPPNRVVSPPVVTLPTQSDLKRLHWIESSSGGWTRLTSTDGATNAYRRRGSEYLFQNIRRAYSHEREVPYLIRTSLLIEPASTIDGRAIDGQPSSGVFVFDPHKTRWFDVTYQSGAAVGLLSDKHGPRAVAFFELDCSACMNERPQIARLSKWLHDRGGLLLVVSSADATSVGQALKKIAPDALVTQDNDHSVYGAFDIHRLPWATTQSSNGRILESYQGQLHDDDVRRFIKEFNASGQVHSRTQKN
jgi:hypothetical protein